MHSQRKLSALMPTDFAPKPERNREARGGFPAIKLLITGLFIGAFVAFLLFLEQGPKPSADNQEANTPAPQASTPPKPPAVTAPEAPKPRYDFWEVLPGKEIYVPQTEADPPRRPPAVNKEPVPVKEDPKPASGTSKSVLQVGSFKSRTDAEALRARLILEGLDAQIRSVQVKGSTWYRVQTGPYANTQQLEATRARLGLMGIQSIVLR